LIGHWVNRHFHASLSCANPANVALAADNLLITVPMGISKNAAASR
jgi:hypothetical protein